MNNQQYYEHELTGLDGGNLLAFMAALGTLRVLSPAADSSAEPSTLSWTDSGGVWRPIIRSPEFRSQLDLLGALAGFCCRHEPTRLREEVVLLRHAVTELTESLKMLRGKSQGAARKHAQEKLNESRLKLAEKEAAQNEYGALACYRSAPAFSRYALWKAWEGSWHHRIHRTGSHLAYLDGASWPRLNPFIAFLPRVATDASRPLTNGSYWRRANVPLWPLH